MEMMIPAWIVNNITKEYELFVEQTGSRPLAYLIIDENIWLEFMTMGIKPIRYKIKELSYGTELFNMTHSQEVLFWMKFRGLDLWSIPP